MSPLAPEHGTWLLALARRAIEQSLGGRTLALPPNEAALDATLLAPRGAFVTLKQREPERLRGCIGNVGCQQPLYRNVIDLAPKAARNDPRFAAVTLGELPTLRIELSVLTPPAPLASVADLIVGEHGIDLEREGQSAVFLPQVAAELGWSAEELLRQLALKAGLPAQGWRGATLRVFRAERFAEAG
jgi:AmmeMemoRadiSam system protein A